MTRPLSHSSPEKKAAVTRATVESLVRRPASAGERHVVEYCRAQSDTDLSTSITPIDWTMLSGSFAASGAYGDAPTFAVNAAGNLEIAKDGVYILAISVFSEVFTPNVDTALLIRGRRISGPTPDSLLGFLGSGGEWAVKLRRLNSPGFGGDITANDYPDWWALLAYQSGAMESASAVSEIEISAYYEEDGAGAANTFADFRLMCARLGPTYVAP